MKNIIYSKYSNERAEEFKIRTDIIEDSEGKKSVKKIPLTEEANIHINNIYRYYELLSESYKDSKVSINKCCKTNEGLEFQYIMGSTLEEDLDELVLKKDYTQLIEKIKEYVSVIGSGIGEKNFKSTESFTKVFGEVNLPTSLRAGDINDIDLVFNNIIVGEKWNIIDYEWTFNFPIPFNYLIYRAIHYYIYSSPKRSELINLGLYKLIGITEEEIVQYENMEKNFQAYILGGLIPLRNLYGTTTQKNVNVQQILEHERIKTLKNTIQVFYDYGQGFSEKQSEGFNLPLNSDGTMSLEIPITSNVKQIRVDPANDRSIVNIKSIIGYSKECYSIDYVDNGIRINDKINLFETDDPQIIINDIKEGTTKIELKLETRIISKEIIIELCDFLQDKVNQIIEKENYIQDLNNELDNYKLHYNSAIVQRNDLSNRLSQIETDYNNILNSTIWKITKPIRVVLDYTKKLLKSNKYTHIICKGLKCLKQNDVKYTLKKIKQKLKNSKNLNDYAKQNILTEEEKQLQVNTKFSKNIKFSIVVPLYNTPEKFLCEMINSCINQTYDNWELCLADGSDKEHKYVKKIVADYIKKDKRIKYKTLEKNGGISENTNECIKMATGDYIALFDHDDLLHPSALFEYMNVICKQNADFIYCDELTFEGTLDKIITMHFKPDFAIDNLRANNYICHFTVFKADLLKTVGMFRKEFDGSQDHDMILRLTDEAKNVVHVPKILYFWRSHPNSVASDINSKTYAIDAGKRAVNEHLKRHGINAIVESSKAFPTIYRFRYELKEKPLISILIPNKDNVEVLSRCVESILKKSTYKNIEIIIIENNSVEQKTFEYYKILEKNENIKVITYKNNGEFNYSDINNFGVAYANGEHLLFLNNDIEIISENWIEEMLMYSQREDVGAVGAKLYYPNDTIQHAGVILKLGAHRCAGHCHYRCSRENLGYMGRLYYSQNFSAVTAACLMIKKTTFNKINGFDTEFAVAFNDVDLCMKIRKAGYLVVWTPYAEAYHYESISRGHEDTSEKQERFNNEVIMFKTKWKKELEQGDPYYNPNLTLDRDDFSLK